MSVPAEIPQLGAVTDTLRPYAKFNPMKAPLGPEEYFLLTRVDGVTKTRDVILGSGVAVDIAISALVKLRTLGAILRPGESVPPVSLAPVPPPAVSPAPTRRASPTFVPTEEEQALLAEITDVPRDDRLELLRLRRRVNVASHELLGVLEADAKAAKTAYLQMSKRLHPDRFYKKQLGSWAPILASVFESLTRANRDVAAQAKARARGGATSTYEHAMGLFEQACSLELSGETAEAHKLFAAAIKLDDKPRYLKRAANCCLIAGQWRQTETYAQRALDKDSGDASAARLLAGAFRGLERYAEAVSTLERALGMRLEHDTIVTELKRDLQEARRLMAAAAR